MLMFLKHVIVNQKNYQLLEYVIILYKKCKNLEVVAYIINNQFESKNV